MIVLSSCDRRAKNTAVPRNRRRQAEQGQIKRWIVPAVLDPPASIRDRGTVTAELDANHCKAQAEFDMGEIHRHLPRKGNFGRAAVYPAQTVKRHSDGQDIFKAIGDVGPAMGMIGTLIGLVQMLSNMDDPKQIGPAMAVALLTTLYGAILANMFALPIADKLAVRSGEESNNKTLIIDALLAIQGGQNPRVIESMLEAYLPPSKRKEDDIEA